MFQGCYGEEERQSALKNKNTIKTIDILSIIPYLTNSSDSVYLLHYSPYEPWIKELSPSDLTSV